ncbi:potassium transporter Kup [Taklimakanibacter deserti]|uniref:potassium transporter Kup n=1 Tax=Taklimakanibacter deserti TaxID=2267839 RepID=UPI000E64FCA8
MSDNPSKPAATEASRADFRRKLKLAFASIGVVFGDIGTSPLYAMRESLAHVAGAGGSVHEDVIAIVSLLIWALILIVTVKYVLILMRADNKGEGGILTLVVLAEQALRGKRSFVLILGVVGAAFFFGDAMITPAISVLSAVEGLTVINPGFDPYVVPITLLILATLFAFQYRGTGNVASLFAPITILWFITIAVLGLLHIGDDPSIFLALNPIYAAKFVIFNPGMGLIIFAGVFLAVTGGEALYADLGHFGRTPIRMAWVFIVLPALILNYLGQGAFVHANPQAVTNPFFLMAPSWGLIPLVVLATLVTVIASQAVITGAFSIAQQAISLGLLPRMNITHTSDTEQGQIYIGQINWLVFAGVILLVLLFGSSADLASAYGIAVNISMIIDTALALIVFWHARHFPPAIVLPVLFVILLVELTFFAANSTKLIAGGYVPVLIGFVIIVTMLTWLRGRSLLAEKLRRDSVELEGLLATLERRPPTRVAGAAVFLQTDPIYAPSALMHNLKHNRVLHDILVFISVKTAEVPRVPRDERVEVKKLPLGAFLVEASFGYMEQPDVPAALRMCEPYGLSIDPRQASYFMGRRAIRTSPKARMPFWQQRLFILLANQSARAIEFFRIPPERVVELGMQMSV